ncbi:MAG TPA: alpha/beta hydrolase [Candidatus Rubrimentiphilum sp.]|nr:alpha/beta hydrolase [Candidatus Rubrimentiphilum sp.]
MKSPLLSAFWGQTVSVSAYILLPDSYYKEPQKRYPVFYWIQGFGGTGQLDYATEADWQRPMRRLHREFIIVFLDGMFNEGHQEFADSANNGPWGAALTTEFIPTTEAYFRAIGDAKDRFVGGHSSGGWSALWLQVKYPDMFGAEWSISPDPVDFHDFLGPDITRTPSQNFFVDAAGHDYELDGQSLRHFVTGPGWEKKQYESFDAVFSPRGQDGKPLPLFNRSTGVIDPAVAQYWEDHYDIAQILRSNWSDLEPKLRGKLHIIVGTGDQFHLNRPVVLLQKELVGLGSDAEFDFAPGANHFTVFDWNGGAIDYIVKSAAAMATP